MMLVREHPDADPAALRPLAATADSRDEWFVREEGRGGLQLTLDDAPDGKARERKLQVLFSGGEFGPSAGHWLFFVGLWTPADYRDEFLAWYRFEHLPILLEHPAWSGCRFAEQRVAEGCQFFAVHQLRDRAALDSPQRKFSRATPWFLRLAKQPWFDGAFTRSLYGRLPR
jgi:hypothetical protein